MPDMEFEMETESSSFHMLARFIRPGSYPWKQGTFGRNLSRRFTNPQMFSESFGMWTTLKASVGNASIVESAAALEQEPLPIPVIRLGAIHFAITNQPP